MNFNVLIVDDEKNIREGLGKALELDGYKTFLAEDGGRALQVVSESEIDLIISDLKMPGVSGEELLKQISASYPAIQVIILTGHGTIETAVNAMRNGAYDFVTKPVNLDRLSLLVKRALSTRDLVRQHRALKEEVELIKQKHKYSHIIGKKMFKLFVFGAVSQPTRTNDFRYGFYFLFIRVRNTKGDLFNGAHFKFMICGLYLEHSSKRQDMR